MDEVNSTVLAGVLVLVIGQLVTRFLLDPLHEFRKLRGKIAHALIYYANVAVGTGLRPEEHGCEARQRLRHLASQLWQRAYAIPRRFYGLLAVLRIVPSWDDLYRASSGLIGLSNSLTQDAAGDREGHRQRVRDGLRLRRVR